MTVKSVAVIGAGVSGLTTVKACLEQGLDVTCYEMHNDVGGLWHYTKNNRPEEGATTFDFLYANTSREIIRFSDFHFPSDAPVFPTRKTYHNYLRDYAEYFGIFKKVELNTKVLSIQETHNYAQPEGWSLELQRNGEDQTEIKEFGAVVIATGYHRKAVIPQFEGIEHFQGKWSHSKTFKTAKPFERKRCVVIGNGNSALDIATGISEYAEQVYISIGKGCWVFPRYIEGMPWDQVLYRRYHFNFLSVLDRKWRQACSNYLDHDKFGLRPAKGPLHYHFNCNDEISSRVANGKIKIIPKVIKFLYDGVQLENGTNIRNVDHVIFATGFTPDHYLIDEEFLSNSYKDVFPVALPKPTLAFVGMTSANGPFPPLAEMQARFVSLVFAGKHKLPHKSIMETDIKRWRNIRESFYGPEKHWTPCLQFTDDIAQEIGVYPSLSKLMLKSPKLAVQVYFGPAFSAHYRLVGNGSTESAVEDTLNAAELTTEGVKLRQVPNVIPEQHLRIQYVLMIVVLTTVIIILTPLFLIM